MTSVALRPQVAHETPRARPFIKWAGGKTQLLPEILARLPSQFNRYFEPFLGGAAVFFALTPKRTALSDLNQHLVGTYQAIRDDVDGVIAALSRHRADETHFYAVRAQDPARLSQAGAAARFIYLNRTCFNGLYRENRKGEFNVPYGRYSNPRIVDEENLRAVAQALQGVDLRVADVFLMSQRARRGDLVYFDPPYDPVSSTASFTGYHASGFGKAEQERLAELFATLAGRGVHLLLSNSDTPFIRELYRDFQVDTVAARRAINSRADRRGSVAEVLVSANI